MTVSSLLAVAIVGSWLVVWLRSRRALVDLPVMGETSLLAPWKVACGLAGPPDKLSQEGYEKYREGSYQFATANGWEVCICNDTLVKELAQLPEEIMSLYAFNDAQFQSEYTSPGFADSGVNLPVQLLSKALAWARVRGSADKDIYFAGLVEDLECGIDQKIGLSAAGLLTSSRDTEPQCQLVAPYFEAPRLSKELDAMLLQLIADRRTSDLKEPQTIIDWLCRWIQTDPSGIYGDIHIAQSLVSVVFGSVHSAGTVLASCLYELSRRPEYIEPLHEEVRRALEEHNGWCKEAIESMVQVDSFIKECHRHRPIAPVALTRLAKSDHTFSNGLFIPRGTVLHVPNTPISWTSGTTPKAMNSTGFGFIDRAGRLILPMTSRSRALLRPIVNLALADILDSLRLGMAYILMHFDVAGDGRLELLDSTLQANLKLRRRNPTKAIQ
ncbi:hypothetical protein N7490_011312 [Penicillium lividum]|nr:hypothetical protein N7490_011312 [Penicillium lividum]